ncbi:mitochondrial ribosome small subunit component [Scheffersomyces coipomensis]|uniref:mitochondrial ribosome small subunit component n=1 Tax=Scheffersomyces coipomensis TaxID=1788519 RepID=UPI00315C54F3
MLRLAKYSSRIPRSYIYKCEISYLQTANYSNSIRREKFDSKTFEFLTDPNAKFTNIHDNPTTINQQDPQHVYSPGQSLIQKDTDLISPFRNPDGTFIKGNNAEEARLHDLTLEGRVDKAVTKLPEEISKVINNNILRLTVPDRLRERVALIYQSLTNGQIQKAPETSLDCDAHIGALFLQEYSHLRQVLLELQKRVGADKFNPQRVLDIGYGPATGLVALNEIMGDEWVPEVKESYIVGRSNNEMKKRAKIILSRQINENFSEPEEEVQVSEEKASEVVEEAIEEQVEEQQENEEEQIEEEYVGPIKISSISIRTKLRDTLPVSKQYDLIMVNNALLTREFKFPRDIDENMSMVLKLLKPGGHLILIQRGNAVGFETIARARQIMIRPESYTSEIGKIPRPYLRGSSLKPQKKLKKEDQLINDDYIEFEKELLEKMEQDELEQMLTEQGKEFEDVLNEKFGETTEDDLKFDGEDEGEFEVIPLESESQVEEDTNKLSSESMDYHIKILAPCAHHKKCPLQLGDPKYYKIPSHKHRLNFCSFNKVVERPKFTMELKRGKRLATSWDKSSEDGFGFDKMSKKSLQSLEGSGRPGGKNTENGSYSYLIAERSLNDTATIQKIENDREFNNYDIQNKLDINNWPRIIDAPHKIKKNVQMTVCAPSGNIEVWQIPRSVGKQEYHDARKVERGDLWALDKKSVTVKSQLSDKVKDKLDVLLKTQKKTFLKEQRKQKWKRKVGKSEEDFHDELYDSMATEIENSHQYKAQGRRANYDVDPRSFDGK